MCHLLSASHILNYSSTASAPTMSEEPFTISISQSALDNLHQKLAVLNLPTAAPESDDEWDYGVPLSDIKRLVTRWRNGYDWRAAESTLNAALPQFTRPIEVEGFGTFSAHYVHKKSNRENAIPLLFLHGCECAPTHLLHEKLTTAL